MLINSSKEILLAALDNYGIRVLSQKGKMIYIEMEYTVEIETDQLFKLLQANQVIAPFADIEELCQFIKMDMQLNEEN